MTLEEIIEATKTWIKENWNLELKQTKLFMYDQKNWKRLIEQRCAPKEIEGLFIPGTLSAHVNLESEYLIPNIFHEYFGHGLFCENTLLGKTLIKKSSIKESSNSIKIITEQEKNTYESIAVWIEKKLCKEFDFEKNFEKKSKKITNYLLWSKSFDELEKLAGEKAVIFSMGFPKYYSHKDILKITKGFYGNKFNEIDLIILYGSKKPISDIDLIIGAGGIIAHTRAEEAFKIIVEAFKPAGITKIAYDKSFKSPHLGVLSTVSKDTAAELFRYECLKEIGYVVAPTGKFDRQKAALTIIDNNSDMIYYLKGDEVLYLPGGGNFTINPADKIYVFKNMREVELKTDQEVQKIHDVQQMLELAAKMEEESAKSYNLWANECSANADSVSKQLFESLVVDEERHFDQYDTETENLKKFGDRYLALQSIERSKGREAGNAPA